MSNPPISALTPVFPVVGSKSRMNVLRKALKTTQDFRTFMVSKRNRNPLQDEAELLWMLREELLTKRDRRSLVRRLHGAICTLRQRREWKHLEITLSKARQG